MYNHNKAQQSKNRVHISWDILYRITRIDESKIGPYLTTNKKNTAEQRAQHTCGINPTKHQSNISQCTVLEEKCAQVCTFLLQNGALYNIF